MRALREHLRITYDAWEPEIGTIPNEVMYVGMTAEIHFRCGRLIMVIENRGSLDNVMIDLAEPDSLDRLERLLMTLER